MTGGERTQTGILPPGIRHVLGIVCVLLVLLLLAGAISIPFLFESQSIRYKTGFDKTLLRTGKVLGMTAATLLLLQLSLSARFKVLDRIFALNRLYGVHRVNAVAVTVLALFHPLFVFAPEDITSIPLELEYWPEALGAFLLVLILLITATGIWRLFLSFPFDRWWVFHRGAVSLAVVMLIVHVLFVSETFEEAEPRLLVFLAAGIYAIVLGWVKTKPVLRKKTPWTVTGVAPAGKDTYTIQVSPRDSGTIQYIPGQFAFISFQSGNVSSEEHPFTISSTPTRPGNLLFSIRCSGDWTGRISRLTPGDTAYIDGAYGHFSYLFHNPSDELIMIAGGIGITPMLSMLRHMVDSGKRRKTTLIWSNRTRDDIVYADEFKELEQQLSKLKLIHVLTRQEKGPDSGSRLNLDKLKKLLSEHSRKTPVFVCGPPIMMQDVKRWLIEIGFRRSVIFLEEFRL